MTLLAVAVGGRGVVDPNEPILRADDEALLRGRAAFETIRVYAGVPFRLTDHIRRMVRSAERLGLPGVSEAELHSLADEALREAGIDDAVLRLYWTPGREDDGSPSTIALVSTIPPGIEEMRARGIALITLLIGVEANLRQVAPWLLGGVKSTSYAVNMAAEEEARRRGADDAVFLASGGIVLEGPVTNVWWRRSQTLFTPALDLGILAGVTRATLIEESAGLGYDVEEGAFPVEELASAEEAFTSSSVREIMPVVRLDSAPIGAGRPGKAAGELQEALRKAALSQA